MGNLCTSCCVQYTSRFSYMYVFVSRYQCARGCVCVCHLTDMSDMCVCGIRKLYILQQVTALCFPPIEQHMVTWRCVCRKIQNAINQHSNHTHTQKKIRQLRGTQSCTTDRSTSKLNQRPLPVHIRSYTLLCWYVIG